MEKAVLIKISFNESDVIATSGPTSTFSGYHLINVGDGEILNNYLYAVTNGVDDTKTNLYSTGTTHVGNIFQISGVSSAYDSAINNSSDNSQYSVYNGYYTFDQDDATGSWYKFVSATLPASN